MTKYLFFDTETTGLPKIYNAPTSDLDNWPRMIQVAWIVTDENGKEYRSGEYIIRPSGFTIPEQSTKIHGITNERAEAEGVFLKYALREMKFDIDEVDFLVAHNISFDQKILGAEFLRTGGFDPLKDKPKICTMLQSTNFCKLAGKYNNYKWPKLEELHRKLFNVGIEGAHNAITDVRACARSFFKLKEMGILKEPALNPVQIY